MIGSKTKPNSIRGSLLLCLVIITLCASNLWLIFSSGDWQRTANHIIQRQSIPSLPCKAMIHVITKPTDFHHRQDIRLTWGASAKNLGMKVRFLIGVVAKKSDKENSWIKRSLREEANLYDDLIQVVSPGRETHNMAYMIASALKHYVNAIELGHSNCRFFMKVDSGVYLQPSKLVTVLEHAENKTKEHFNMIYMGHFWLKGRVIRDKKSPWYIRGGIIENLSEDVQFYPPYASGKAYLVSSKLARMLVSNKKNQNQNQNQENKDTESGCFSPAKVNLGPEDAQLGLCVDKILSSNNADIAFVRSKTFNTNHCDAESVVVEIASSKTDSTSTSVSASTLTTSTISSSIGFMYHAHTASLAGESLCNILHGQKKHDHASQSPYLVIAVTSSLKSFEMRANAITRTWGSPLNLDRYNIALHFFVGADVKQHILEICDRIGIGHNQVIALEGVVDNEYPPVLKNTAMLAKVHEMLQADTNLHYNWVLKVDDDTLVNLQGLYFLTKFNPLTQKLYLGQQGTGIPSDRGKLGIVKPFCMGGPGYVISRAALNILGPNLKQCAANKMSRKDHSWHSDVIIGLCMEEYTHIGCWDNVANTVIKYRPLKRFFHKYDFVRWPLHKELTTTTTTLHPLKDPALMRLKYKYLIEA